MTIYEQGHRKAFHNYIRRYDEYYTRYEHVKHIFENLIIEDLKDKIIYCPCDSDESNFVIYLKEHKDDLQYKELIYTSDDYNTHYDLFEKCDIIITNPPFSKLMREFIPLLNKVNKKFFILGSLIGLGDYYRKFNDNANIKYFCDIEHFDFIMPEGCTLKNNPAYIYISNMNISYNHKETQFNKEEKNMVYAIRLKDGKKFKHYSKIANIPVDEYDEIFVPSTILLEHNRKYFDIIDAACNFDNRHPNKCEYDYEDHKLRYKRILVKRKKIK